MSVNDNNSNWYNAGTSAKKMNSMFAAAQFVAAIPGSLHRTKTMVFFEKLIKTFGNLKYFCYICNDKVLKHKYKKKYFKKVEIKFGNFKFFCYICNVIVL